MIPTMTSLAGSSKTTTVTENFVFRLHSRFTSLTFFALAICVFVHTFFTDVIDCTSSESISHIVLDSICYVQGTFSVASAWDKNVGLEVPYPGLESYSPNEERVYHSYYKWVGWLLLIQAMLFFLPGYFWRSVENGRVQKILRRLDKTEREEQVIVGGSGDALAFLKQERNRENLALLSSFVFFGLLNTISLMVQIILLNHLLNNQFWSYGWFALFSSGTTDIQTKVFPDQAKCTLLRFASSGDIQRSDSTCILSSNFLYAQLYLVIWFWFLFLLVLGLLDLICRIITIFNKRARLASTQLPLIRPHCDELGRLVERLPLGSWFIFHLVTRNLDTDRVNALAKDILPSLNLDGFLAGSMEIKANGNGKAV